jgi:ABC-type multidrug transport system ATPase subunit/ABC-type multidrug transport system permease subunit
MMHEEGDVPLVAAGALLRADMDIEKAEPALKQQPSPIDDHLHQGRYDSQRGLDIEWRDIECFVSEPPKKSRGRKWLDTYVGLPEVQGPPTKQIMRGACGFAKAGELLAVMGPSGSGKTTLLNVLGQRPTLGQKGKWTGTILLNGAEPWKDWERNMAYVMQKDIFYDELTVYENLLTTALLRLPSSWSRADKIAHLESKISELGLQKVKDTKIGTAVERGLSGGEVKRASIANESLALPRIFLLDEPLTGLDSTRAVDVMQNLKSLAHDQGSTVMLTIHQPSSALYACFDRLLLLGAGGRTAFFGDISEAVPHFSKLGHPLPELWAPADHFIELLSVEQKRDEVCDAWEGCHQPEAPAPSPRPPSLGTMPAFTEQVRVLLPRSLKRIRRSYLKSLSCKLQIALAVCWGFIYFGVGNDAHERYTDLTGCIFFIVAHWSWTPLFQGLGNFPKEKEMLTKERASKVYRIGSFFVSQVIAEAPVLLVLPILFFAILWPMAALPGQALVPVFVIIALNLQVCSSMSMLISVGCMNDEASISTAIVVMVFQMCAGGYFADMRLLPPWIGWVRFISFYFYTNGAVSRLIIAGPYGDQLQKQALSKYSFSELGFFWEIVILCAMSVCLRALAYVQLRFTKKLNFS